MFFTRTNHWGGAALVLGSLLFIVNKLNDISAVFLNRFIPDVISGQNILLVAIGQIALVVGLVGCYRLYAPRTSRFGKIGLGLLLGGGILLALGHIVFTPLLEAEWLFLFVVLGAFLMFAGLLLFGAVNLRQPALAFWQWVPLVTGVLGVAGFLLSGGSENPGVFLPLRTLFGLGLVFLGVVMWLDKREPVAYGENPAQLAR